MSRELPRRSPHYTSFVERIENQQMLFKLIQEHDQNVDLIDDLIFNIENFAVAEFDEMLYQGLFNIYQNGNQKCQLFVLQFVPSLISAHLSMIGCRLAVRGGKLETLLLSIYNKETASNTELPFTKSFRIPSLSNSSIYHEPAGTTSTALTERALSRHEQSDKPVLMKVPTKMMNRLTVSARSEVVKTILSIYNCNISAMVESSHLSFCRMVTKVARSGFPNLDCDDVRLTNVLTKSEIDSLKHQTRMKLSNEVYQQMITGLYFIMHDGLADKALIALEKLAVMSDYQLNAALTMTLNALTDSIQRSLKESDMQLCRNPNTSIRRITDTARRRYAISSSSGCQRPSSTTDNVDSGTRAGVDKDSALKVCDDTSVSVPVKNVITVEEASTIEDVSVTLKSSISVEDKSDSPLLFHTNETAKLPSESEDEAVNENTTLLGEAGGEGRTGSSDVIYHPKMIKVNISNCDNVYAVLDNGPTNEITENKIRYEERQDTQL